MSLLLASPRGSRLAAGRRVDRPLDGVEIIVASRVRA
jgi:hypothetical protein